METMNFISLWFFKFSKTVIRGCWSLQRPLPPHGLMRRVHCQRIYQPRNLFRNNAEPCSVFSISPEACPLKLITELVNTFQSYGKGSSQRQETIQLVLRHLRQSYAATDAAASWAKTREEFGSTVKQQSKGNPNNIVASSRYHKRGISNNWPRVKEDWNTSH